MANRAYAVEDHQIQRSEHPDYKTNYKTAKSAMENLNKIPGLKLNLEGSGAQGGTLPFSVLMISWTHPDQENPSGRFACPIFLHQNMESFSREITQGYEKVCSVARSKLGIFDYEEQTMF